MVETKIHERRTLPPGKAPQVSGTAIYCAWQFSVAACLPECSLNVVIDDVVYLMSANTPDAAQAWCE